MTYICSLYIGGITRIISSSSLSSFSVILQRHNNEIACKLPFCLKIIQEENNFSSNLRNKPETFKQKRKNSLGKFLEFIFVKCYNEPKFCMFYINKQGIELVLYLTRMRSIVVMSETQSYLFRWIHGMPNWHSSSFPFLQKYLHTYVPTYNYQAFHLCKSFPFSSIGIILLLVTYSQTILQ